MPFLPLLAAIAGAAHPPAQADDDPYAWLEQVHGERALAWVRARNAEVEQEIAAGPRFEALTASIREVLDSKAKIPMVVRRGSFYYNFWKDEAHPRGLWRRATLAEYRKEQPAWETLLDVDALAAAGHENWVWEGAVCLRPDYRRCLLRLSRGGADAVVVREFDLSTRAFVPGGFTLPEAKTDVAWRDVDAIYVGTDFGPGSLTTSGYPRVAKLWRRGTPLAEAKQVFEGKPEDVSVSAYRDLTPGFERDFVTRALDFFSSQKFLLRPDGQLARIEIPDDADLDVEREWMLVRLRTAWTVGATTYPSGTLLAARFDDFLAGKRDLVVVFAPTATAALQAWSWTRHYLILDILDDVRSRIEILTPGAWTRRDLGGLPPLDSVHAYGTDADVDDEAFVTREGFLTPTTLSRVELPSETQDVLKRNPAFFDTTELAVRQFFARSKDGTRVPYFVVGPEHPRKDALTMLTGYGGFEVSELPFYDGGTGRGWLAGGDFLAVANIRGGGEYGPAWHQAALKANRPRAYEDFAAVARDLVARKITSRKRLGIYGGSNGGLLMGNMLTEYPRLFGAVVCGVPLLDMKRYTHLSAGASWIAEYGDPDKPDEWAFIRKFSPYQNARADVRYPPVLFFTSTRDDRVGPVQARKMAAKLLAMGHDVRFYENIEGGHGAAANNAELAFQKALRYAYLRARLGKPTRSSR
ncbi:MAG TPA: prolyl oligopeptidase family serine peptidase [Myxococcales bacterium]|nr:prolyl oligopeptidase family serine peptidase [Myxococcales bacterium]